MRKWATPVLAIYLIAAGLLPFLGARLASAELILSLLAVAAGALLLLGGTQARLPGGLGRVLLAAWLILVGALPLLQVSLPSQEILLGLLAVAAGVLLLLRR
jgi:hypothetical protein